MIDYVQTLKNIRDMCAFNLNNPGNEDDTFNYIIDVVNGMLQDGYEFEYFPDPDYED